MYERYVDKLRSEDPEKLTQFCKLHLSFLLDMDSERFEELFGEKQNSRSKLGNLLLKRRSLGKAGWYACISFMYYPSFCYSIKTLIFCVIYC